MDITCVVDAKAELGEGTIWDPKAGVLWWIDIWSRLIHRYDPRTGKDDTWESPEYLGCIGLRERGGLVVTMVSGFYFFDPGTGAFEAIVDPEAHLPLTRFNDGKPDRQGRFWSGSMFEAPGRQVEFIGSLYRMDKDLSVHRMIEGVGCCNGLAWSPDSKTMYFSDSHTTIVRAYDFDPVTGDIENQRTFIDLDGSGGIADGATVDADGCYWVTVPVTSKVNRYDPEGKLMQSIVLPTDLPTCCEFGGENLDILYVTTAVLKRPAEHFKGQSNPGGLFAIDVGAKGLALPAFVG
ncbi:SMP-30/gluconolactonase/LRE family protein [Devosia sp. ZB163]|uniref:SMP-30/gluconolactonase/LRE family protein n=1 Tax=Devosia sp. ZB163 TaxID=3025938 RepID=UPI00235E227A|nr:SMP-30/gluconolactonase/LRE family protein [Devosia sp. ZB163]MDC9826326.1 SMP-30/gluconolactonase/LRE family protein [Devosia sp. ZB163]